jgi:hypothetical protein
LAAEHGLTVKDSGIPRRTVVLAGKVAKLRAAFAVDLSTYQAGEIKYRGCEGPFTWSWRRRVPDRLR